jgi:plastocyanin
VSCTGTGGGTTADATGTLSNYQIGLAPTAVAAAAMLRFRGVNTPGSTTHNLSLRDSGNTWLCGTPNLPAGSSETFIVTNLPAGSYELYCTLHPSSMHAALTVG